MPELSAAIDVPAPPETVWAVLTDVESYPQWNTLLRVSGEYVPEATLSARLSVPGLPAVRFSPTIVSVEPERELTWRTKLFGVEATHQFVLEPSADGTETRFVQREWVEGPFVGQVVGRLERRLVRGFEQMNVGLRRRAIELAETDA